VPLSLQSIQLRGKFTQKIEGCQQGWFLFPPQFLWFDKVIEGTHANQRIREEEKLGTGDGGFGKNLR
jgi:hypothetical protein